MECAPRCKCCRADHRLASTEQRPPAQTVSACRPPATCRAASRSPAGVVSKKLHGAASTEQRSCRCRSAAARSPPFAACSAEVKARACIQSCQSLAPPRRHAQLADRTKTQQNGGRKAYEGEHSVGGSNSQQHRHKWLWMLPLLLVRADIALSTETRTNCIASTSKPSTRWCHHLRVWRRGLVARTAVLCSRREPQNRSCAHRAAL